jgi:hypothetical protein
MSQVLILTATITPPEVYSCTVEGYDRLLRGGDHQLRFDILGHGSEFSMRPAIGKHLDAGGIVPRFRIDRYVEGYRGWDNSDYNHGKNYTSYLVRAASREIVPGMWIWESARDDFPIGEPPLAGKPGCDSRPIPRANSRSPSLRRKARRPPDSSSPLDRRRPDVLRSKRDTSGEHGLSPIQGHCTLA